MIEVTLSNGIIALASEESREVVGDISGTRPIRAERTVEGMLTELRASKKADLPLGGCIERL